MGFFRFYWSFGSSFVIGFGNVAATYVNVSVGFGNTLMGFVDVLSCFGRVSGAVGNVLVGDGLMVVASCFLVWMSEGF